MDSFRGDSPSSATDPWYDRGLEAMEQKNWDYALECFSKAVDSAPDRLDYRKEKYRSSRRKHRKQTAPSKVDSIRLAALRSRILTAETRKDWAAVDRLAEEGITVTPWDSSLFAHVATATGHQQLYDIAKYAWTTAIKLAPENSAYYRAFGGLLQALGEYEQAKACYSRIHGIDPTGRIASELIQAVEVEALMNRGYTSAENARDVEVGREPRPARPEPEDIEVEDVQPAEQRLVGFISLAEKHVRAGRLVEAVQAFRNARQLAPDNRSIRYRAEDVELAACRQQALRAQEDARQHPDCMRRRALATQQLTDATSRELTILTRRVEQDPDNMLQVFRLADLYRRSNQLEEAVPLFEQVSSDPELCPEALIGLGECWIRTNRAEHGRIQLEKALRLIDRAEKPNSCKLAHYWLGRIYEARRKFDEADDHYEQILEMDAGFRDTAIRRQRLRELRAAEAG